MNTAEPQPDLQDQVLSHTPAVDTMFLSAASFSVAAVTLWLAFFD